MPDEPTNKEILEWLSNDDYQCMAHNDLYDAQWNDRVRKAIRRRIERKVSREWVEQYLNAIKYCGRDGLMAGLKELGYEVDNA